MYNATIESYLSSPSAKRMRGKVQLIFTSPPFPLNHKKRYGNRQGDDYIDWLSALAPRLADLLTPDGSIVVEVGNSWEPGRPVMSTLALRSLLAFLENGELNLCQEFICHNPARLPSPIQWVNIERIRVKDSFTHVWWMARTDRPKADNRKVLTAYSKSMERLLQTRRYNSGLRPSGFGIGTESFLKDNGGSIPPSVMFEPTNFLVHANTRATDSYIEHCKAEGVELHPARMQQLLAEFFVLFLTDPGDWILDPFAGSNTTGFVSEELRRRWISIEADADYAKSSQSRFTGGNRRQQQKSRTKAP